MTDVLAPPPPTRKRLAAFIPDQQTVLSFEQLFQVVQQLQQQLADAQARIAALQTP